MCAVGACTHANTCTRHFPSRSTQTETFSTHVDTNRIKSLILFPSLADPAESLSVEYEYYMCISKYTMSISPVAGLTLGCGWPLDPLSPQLAGMSPQGPQPCSSCWSRANWSSGKGSRTTEQALRELQAGQDKPHSSGLAKSAQRPVACDCREYRQGKLSNASQDYKITPVLMQVENFARKHTVQLSNFG